jgi:hypothetical protein
LKKLKFVHIKNDKMEEVLFLVEESKEGGFIAKGLGVSIFTESDTLEDLRQAVKDAIRCHFDDERPRLVRLHMVKEEIFAA